ncbi:uncharacterized protein MONBRDRAFT_13496, partial [Monosiga brevicollis MX1]
CSLQQVDIEHDDVRYGVFVQYVEIYNNYCYDLLVPPPPEKEPAKPRPPTRQSLKISQDETGHRYVREAIWKEVHTPEEAFELLHQGQITRATAATDLNATSSRSHSIFTIRLVSAPTSMRGNDVQRDGPTPHVADISLVDLAGSERTSRTNSTGDRRKEAGAINKSLSVLRDCMKALRRNQDNGSRGKPKFNESSLTKLFERFLTGDGLAAMVVCASPAQSDASETAHVFDFAKVASDVQVEAPVHVMQDHGKLLDHGVRTHTRPACQEQCKPRTFGSFITRLVSFIEWKS